MYRQGNQKEKEKSIISTPNAIVDPRTVMIECLQYNKRKKEKMNEKKNSSKIGHNKWLW